MCRVKKTQLHSNHSAATKVYLLVLIWFDIVLIGSVILVAKRTFAKSSHKIKIYEFKSIPSIDSHIFVENLNDSNLFKYIIVNVRILLMEF